MALDVAAVNGQGRVEIVQFAQVKLVDVNDVAQVELLVDGTAAVNAECIPGTVVHVDGMSLGVEVDHVD